MKKNTDNTVVKIFNNPQETCENLADFLIERITEHTQSTKTPFTITLSGGSTPKRLFSILATKKYAVDWNSVAFFWGDERMVDEKSSESNYGEFKRILVDTGIIPKTSVYPIRYTGNALHDLQHAIDDITRIVPIKNGLPQFNMTILGVGEDGHTASIFPQSNISASFTSTKIAEYATHPQTGQQRITMTGSVLNNSACVVLLCTGQSKESIIKNIIADKNKALPASYVAGAYETIWYLDENAAKLL